MPPEAKQIYFNELAERWDSLPGPGDATSRIGALVGRCSDGPVAGWVLDAGCGTGVLLPALLDRHLPSCRIIEFDFAERMLRVNVAKNLGERVKHVCGDSHLLPLRDESLDLAICFGLYPHLDQPEAALREMLRALKPGGLLAVCHLRPSHELNAFHSTIDGPVAGDYLPPAGELKAHLCRLGAVDVVAEESPDLYLVRGTKARP